jgi:hypothetical protein
MAFFCPLGEQNEGEQNEGRQGFILKPRSYADSEKLDLLQEHNSRYVGK